MVFYSRRDIYRTSDISCKGSIADHMHYTLNYSHGQEHDGTCQADWKCGSADTRHYKPEFTCPYFRQNVGHIGSTSRHRGREVFFDIVSRKGPPRTHNYSQSNLA